MRTLLVLLLLLLLAGCQSLDLPKEEIIEKDRPLAGRVSVEGDPTRVTPAAGERASYQILVGSPGPQVSWNYALLVCKYSFDADGVPICDLTVPPVAPLAIAAAMPPVSMPTVAFAVPPLSDDEDQLLVEGLLCPGELDPALLAALQAGDVAMLLDKPNPCFDKTHNGLLIAAPFRTQRTPDDINHAPQITDVSFTTEATEDGPISLGTPWLKAAEATAQVTGCVGQGYPEVHALEPPLGFQFKLDDAARETYLEPALIPGEPAKQRTEVPYVLGYASSGSFEILRDNQLEAGQLLQLQWRPRKKAFSPDGELVRFWFLASDDRRREAQAASWIERALCVIL